MIGRINSTLIHMSWKERENEEKRGEEKRRE